MDRHSGKLPHHVKAKETAKACVQASREKLAA